MRRNLFICCESENREKYKTNVKRAFEDSVSIVEQPEKADLIYAIGDISPGMREQMDMFEKKGIKVVHVNENLVNARGYEAARKFPCRSAERGR